MARCPNFVQIVLVMCLLAVPAHGTIAGVSQSTTASASACTATSWIDVRCYGAAGNGSTDDTAAINRALSAALATDQPLFLPHGTYKLTRPLIIDYRTRSDTGFRVISMGAILDGKTIAAQPVSRSCAPAARRFRQKDAFISTSKEPCSSMAAATATPW